MSLRKTPLSNNEHYHIYNRGVEKRDVFLDKKDALRFLESLKEFNCENPIGSLYENSFIKGKIPLGSEASKLVDIVAYCINPNHFHLILRQNLDKGIEKFMQRLGTGYTKYFNNRNKRNGNLFQGVFKSKHIDSNEYLLYLSAYVNLNDKIHGINSEEKVVFSSLKEYITENGVEGVCKKSVVLDQYESGEEYKIFLDDSLSELIRQKEQQKDLEE